MLKKISLILSITAALGIGTVVSADAKGGGHGGGHHGGGHHGGHHGGGHHGGGHHGGGHHDHAARDAHEHGAAHNRNRYVVGKSYDGHIWFGQTGHRWHGRWYAYGVGPCWIYVDGMWFWNPVACPL